MMSQNPNVATPQAKMCTCVFLLRFRNYLTCTLPRMDPKAPVIFKKNNNIGNYNIRIDFSIHTYI